ncbi:hypothetical protein ALC62_08540 [Cyphomyrmex costatus]|uniref:Uncharacterized protein n=1 Tax=Cyphomyrmex costatus TaxID=456900 RepID=A0A151IGU4_9HYME|nr:hypothetical protein ALC62_08540 [Cyphomyrmex costatus]
MAVGRAAGANRIESRGPAGGLAQSCEGERDHRLFVPLRLMREDEGDVAVAIREKEREEKKDRETAPDRYAQRIYRETQEEETSPSVGYRLLQRRQLSQLALIRPEKEEEEEKERSGNSVTSD